MAVELPERTRVPDPGIQGPDRPGGDTPRQRLPAASRWIAVPLSAAVVAAVVAALVGRAVAARPAPTARPTARTPAPVADVHAVLDRVLPAVVSVTATTPTGRATGTGMVLTADGDVLTNHHVVAGAATVSVMRYGTTEALSAHVVGSSPADDLALVKIDRASSLPTVTFARSGDVRVGDSVVAIGDASGLSEGTPTVTQGIVSALGRTRAPGGAGGGALTGLIQTDATVSPSNSGGPLADVAGRVIGVIAEVARTGPGGAAAQNIGFAVPSDHVHDLLGQLRAGRISETGTGNLGVLTLSVGPAIQQAFGLVPGSGALVTAVAPRSPAAAAGIAEGDVIVAVQGDQVDSSEALARLVDQPEAGSPIAIDVVRGTNQLRVWALVGAAPEQP
jgi:S1-C subfamily serine protease